MSVRNLQQNKKEGIHSGKDHVNVVEKLSKKIVGTKSPWTTLAALHRQLRMLTPLYNVRDPSKKEKAHPRTVFLFNDMLISAKERGRAGRGEGIHYYSYKLSFSLCGLKVTTFSNDYYQHGIQIYSKLDSRVLVFFNAKDEQTKKVFFDELLDCIEETYEMESDRITREKQKHLGTRFNRSGMDMSRASLTLPKKMKKPSPDTISLIDSASSMESLSTAGLLGSKQLSSSLLNINEGGGARVVTVPRTRTGLLQRTVSDLQLQTNFVESKDHVYDDLKFSVLPEEVKSNPSCMARRKSDLSIPPFSAGLRTIHDRVLSVCKGEVY
ncbi:IQ motif and S7 domain-containing protein 1 [Desmophyllum pertusum]|uniref:IQ motif and S7 domain-containing protein 1 n=1 Tax=Desmophyllum pertusum TaxID=174260 RepID=A0A9W9ZE72_9CNID|nr:IQ motif and S7 domain-containing protein 1 [Desmophyllum pertusum]